MMHLFARKTPPPPVSAATAVIIIKQHLPHHQRCEIDSVEPAVIVEAIAHEWSRWNKLTEKIEAINIYIYIYAH